MSRNIDERPGGSGGAQRRLIRVQPLRFAHAGLLLAARPDAFEPWHFRAKWLFLVVELVVMRLGERGSICEILLRSIIAGKPAEKKAAIAQPTRTELRQTPTAKVPLAVGASAMGAADRKVRGALARLSSELSSATTRDEASSAITRAKNALRAVENVPVHAALEKFAEHVPALGFKHCPSFLQLNKDAWAGVRDGHLDPAYGELSASARSLQDLDKRTQKIVVDDAVKDAVGRASDFASGFLDGSNPLPAPAMGAVFHHDAAYRNGQVLGILVGFVGDAAAMAGGGTMMGSHQRGSERGLCSPLARRKASEKEGAR